ncbi:MAG: phosphohydrolase [Thiotrichales bacterium SG8_50]|nr:MAG: phosphohydrolase [Thiotrichales bacterium SG8_50]
MSYHDSLDILNGTAPLSEKLRAVHDVLRERHDGIDRIAAAIYDPKTDLVKTFLYSSIEPSPLGHYQAKLGEAESLREIVEQRRPRVVNDLRIFDSGDHEHTKKIASAGYASSYTMPMFVHGALFGFLFFNSYNSNTFLDGVLQDLDLFGHLIALAINNDLSALQTLLATVKTARDMARQRDTETGAHLDRMARYARLIARKLAARGKYALSDEFIEHVFVLAPLHDIGKIGIPDNVLLKPAKLSPEELALMREHPIKGRQLIDNMVNNFELSEVEHVDVLRNIAEFHHEAVDGSGYPYGLQGDDIPIEARIVAVADVFDALTSRRPYKHAWSNDEAYIALRRLGGVKLDRDCVDALIGSVEEVREIQQRFRDENLADALL